MVPALPEALAQTAAIAQAITRTLPLPIDAACRLACWFVEAHPEAAAAYAAQLRG
jgi:hypothetical protein